MRSETKKFKFTHTDLSYKTKNNIRIEKRKRKTSPKNLKKKASQNRLQKDIKNIKKANKNKKEQKEKKINVPSTQKTTKTKGRDTMKPLETNTLRKSIYIRGMWKP